MRLVCPSCSAEYEIDDGAIGARGRMVRCASCAAEWFQAPPVGAAAPLPPEPAPEADPVPPSVTDAAPQITAPEPDAPAADGTLSAAVEEEERPRVDFSALRHGLNAPEGEEPTYRVADGVEPGEPSLADPVVDDPAVDERIRFDDEPPVVDATAADFDAVDEPRDRNATDAQSLAASLRAAEHEQQTGGGGAFLAGFATVTLLALVAIAVYVKAPDIAALAPAAEGPLAGYANAIDQGRMALASLIKG